MHLFTFEGSYLLTDENNKHGGDMLLMGRSPEHGEIMQMPHLARTFKVSFVYSLYTEIFFNQGLHFLISKILWCQKFDTRLFFLESKICELC